MMGQCLDISRLLSIIGLILDIFGVLFIFNVDFLPHKIEAIREKGRPESNQENPLISVSKNIWQPKKMTEADRLEYNNTLAKRIRKLKCGICFLIAGFFLQIFGLLIYRCVPFNW